MQHTPWFSVNNPPARPGVYNISCRDFSQSGTWFSYFDGEKWNAWESSVHKADTNKNRLVKWTNGDDFYENWTWRGLILESST